MAKKGLCLRGKTCEFFLHVPIHLVFIFQKKLACYSKCLGSLQFLLAYDFSCQLSACIQKYQTFRKFSKLDIFSCLGKICEILKTRHFSTFLDISRRSRNVEVVSRNVGNCRGGVENCSIIILTGRLNYLQPFIAIGDV